MRQRLRDAPEGGVDYQVVRSNDRWWEHQARTLASAGLIAFFQPSSVLDLACGDGSLTLAANRLKPIKRVTFVDVSEPTIELLGRMTEKMRFSSSLAVSDVESFLDKAIANTQHWDMVLLCEFLEHVDDPARILRKARRVAAHLLASSPLIEGERVDDNPEHLWAFDNEGYLELLLEAGWTPRICQNLMLHEGYYNFQLWGCRG